MRIEKEKDTEIPPPLKFVHEKGLEQKFVFSRGAGDWRVSTGGYVTCAWQKAAASLVSVNKGASFF